MQSEQEQIARRAVACKGFRWMRGMNTTTGDTFIAFSDCDEAYWLAHPDDPCEVAPIAGLLPDLTDAATLGCLLALVREAWGQDDLVAFRFDGQWCAEVTPKEGQHHAFYGSSEAEALVAALESAP